MADYRYDGPVHVFKKSEDDEGTPRGGVGTFNQDLVERYEKQGHIFTPMDKVKGKEAEAAKAVTKEALVAANQTGEGAGTVSR